MSRESIRLIAFVLLCLITVVAVRSCVERPSVEVVPVGAMSFSGWRLVGLVRGRCRIAHVMIPLGMQSTRVKSTSRPASRHDLRDG